MSDFDNKRRPASGGEHWSAGDARTAAQRRPPPAASRTEPASQPAASRGFNPFLGMFDGHNRYSVSGEDKSEPTERQHWRGWGAGAGNREGDLPGKDGVENSKISEMPEVGLPNLEGISNVETTGAGEKETGVYRESSHGKWGTVVETPEQGFKPTFKWDPGEGSVSVEGGEARAAIGQRYKLGARGNVATEGKYGSADASGDAYLIGELGADANVGANLGYKDGKFTGDGISASANAGGRLGAGFSGDADARSRGLHVDGVDKDLDMGIGAHGEGFVGMKGGIGGKIGAGPEFIGAEGRLGGFIGAELAGDVHGNIGPLGGKLGGSLMAGAGAGLEGGITLEGGKLKIGGRMYAALGYGGSFNGEVEIDLKQAYQLGVRGAKELYEVADADKDNRLTLNDPATHVALGMKGGASLVDKAVTGMINFLDADKSGKFGKEDIMARVDQAGEALGDARDKVIAGGKALLERGHDALDVDGDGKLSMKDVGMGYDRAREVAGDAWDTGSKAVKDTAKSAHDFLDHDKDGKLEMSDITAHLGDAGSKIVDTGRQVGGWVADKAGAARDWAGEKLDAAGHAIHDAADVNHDGKVDLSDAAQVGRSAWKGVKDTGKALADTAHGAMKEVHDTIDLNHDGKVDSKDAAIAAGKVGQMAKAAKKAAVDTFHKTVAAGQRAYHAAEKKVADLAHAADLDHDGKLGLGDLRKGAGDAYHAASDTVHSAAKAVHRGLDVDDDGKLTMKDVSAGYSHARDAVVGGAKAAAETVTGGAKAVYHEAKEQLGKAYDTLSDGYKSAASTVSGTWNRVTSFFGW